MEGKAQAAVTAAAGVIEVAWPAVAKGRKATEAPSSCKVRLPVRELDAKGRSAILKRLECDPLELGAMLSGKVPASLAKLLPEAPPWAEAADGQPQGSCACGKPNCRRIPAAAGVAAERWQSDLLLRLKALGAAPETLGAAVFAAWAQDVKTASRSFEQWAKGREGVSAEATPQEGPSLGDWLAEAAVQGRLHEPGPQLHDVRVQLSPDPGAEPPEVNAAALAVLLPAVRGAAGGLAAVAAKAMERAAALAQDLKPE